MKKNTLFTGSAVAIITPFTKSGVDFDAFGKLIEYQIANGTQAIIVCGTTGEPTTMTKDEKAAVIQYCIEKTAHRIPVIVGAGSNNTADAVSNAIQAHQFGADALLVVTPYYNKCTVKGLV
ncbi:MAG: dihydrodipicolinate synthase family protein, partial [Clostridiales bacterium]|nr:dihydrodipicolinate synthase family protein [Clostridiales bacterium]